MKITLKTLKGQQLPLDVEPDMTVEVLKQKIQDTHGHAAETQKLIAYGKVMDDDTKSLQQYSIQEGGFIVVMTQKAKPQKPAATEDAKQPEAAAQPGVTLPAQQPQPAASVSASQPDPPQVQPQPQPQPSSSSGAGGLPPGVSEESVNTLVAITNKPRDLCVMALQLTQGNADMACSVLFEGLDMNAMQALIERGTGGHSHGNDGYDDYGAEDFQPQPNAMPSPANMPGAQAINPQLAALFNSQQFAQIAARMRENPSFYQEFIQQTQQQNPAMFAAIQANQTAFMNAIMTGNPNIGLPTNLGGPGPMGAGAGPAAPHGAPHNNAVEVNRDEMEAIRRLQALGGFSEAAAVQAYFACDKNEEFAANFLFESAFEDESAMMQAAVAQSIPAQAQPSAQPEAQAQQQQPDQQQQPADNAQPPQNNDNPGGNNDGAGNPDGGNNGGEGDGDAGAGAGAGAGGGGEESAFQ